MDSFSVWIMKGQSEVNSALECHINLWHPRKGDPYIDVGVLIPLTDDITKFAITLPFKTVKISDLSSKIGNAQMASLIFNADCNCTTSHFNRQDYTYIGINSERILLVPTDNNELIGVATDYFCDTTRLCVDINKLKNISNLECKKAYIRFRIIDPIIKGELFCKLKKKNLFLESAFTRTQIVDIKINALRNINGNIIAKMDQDNWKLAELSSVHFFVMEPAQSMLVYGDSDAECRRLEVEWGAYLENSRNIRDNNFLAYHWSKKSDATGTNFGNYSKLITISSSETNWFIIIIYLLIVVFLSFLGSALYGMIPQKIPYEESGKVVLLIKEYGHVVICAIKGVLV